MASILRQSLRTRRFLPNVALAFLVVIALLVILMPTRQFHSFKKQNSHLSPRQGPQSSSDSLSSSTAASTSSSTSSSSSSTSSTISTSSTTSITSSTTSVISSSTQSTSTTSSTSSSSSSSSLSSSSSSSSSSVSRPTTTSRPVTPVRSPTTTGYTPVKTTSVPVPSEATESDSPQPSTDAVAAASNNFWSNKGAVGGTFATVSIVCLGVILALVVGLHKHRKQKRDEQDIEYFDKNQEPDFQSSPVPPSPRHSLGQSIGELASQQPMNAYSSRDVYPGSQPYNADHDVYGHAQPAENDAYAYGGSNTYETSQQYGNDAYSNQGYQQQEYNNYPPGTTYASMEQETQYPNYAQYEQSSESRTAYAHPYASNASITGSAPVVSYPPPIGRDSGYQPSVDSFYGETASGRAL